MLKPKKILYVICVEEIIQFYINSQWLKKCREGNTNIKQSFSIPFKNIWSCWVGLKAKVEYYKNRLF